MTGKRDCSIRLLAVLLIGSGAAVWGAENKPAGPVLEMPPMVVEEAQRGLDWLYAKSDGCEYLSLCSEKQTQDFIAGIYAAHRTLETLIPPSLQVRLSVPTTFILYPESAEESVPKDLRDQMQAADPTAASRVSFLSTLRLDDDDSTQVFAILRDDENVITSPELTIRANYAGYLLGNHTPTPPTWLFDGLIGLYGTCDPDAKQLNVPAFTWLSAEQSEELRDRPNTPRALLPLAELFLTDPPKGGEDPASRQHAATFAAEAALFVRWAHQDGDADRIAAFRRFATLACEGPVTEAQFRDCFGMGYADMRDELSDYLPTAVNDRFSLSVPPTIPPSVPITDATKPQIWRIKGEWERRSAIYIKKRSAALAAVYERRTRATFERAVGSGLADADLKGSAGIFAYEMKDFARARSLLAEAAAAQVGRPDVYFDLGRILYTEASANPAGKDGKLSRAQREAIGRVIEQGLSHEPETAGLFALLSDLEYHSEESKPDRYLPLMDRGAHLYPGFSLLIYRTIIMEAVAGNRAEADYLMGVTLRRDLSADDRQ